MADDFKFFCNETSDYFLLNIRCVGEIRKTASTIIEEGFYFVFKVYFSYNLDIELAFDNHKTAGSQRRELIGRMMDYWGPDQVIFLNGFDRDVTVVPAIEELNDVVKKDRRAGFAIILSGVPQPLYAVFTDPQAAEVGLAALRRKLERHRRQKTAEKIAVGS